VNESTPTAKTLSKDHPDKLSKARQNFLSILRVQVLQYHFSSTRPILLITLLTTI